MNVSYYMHDYINMDQVIATHHPLTRQTKTKIGLFPIAFCWMINKGCMTASSLNKHFKIVDGKHGLCYVSSHKGAFGH